jgi:DNA-binding IclR family transcriptional regulator
VVAVIARSATSQVLDALDDHALPEVIAAAAGLSLLQTLRILQELEARGLAERYGKECWGKRRG